MAVHFLLGNKGAHMYNGNPYQCQKCERCFKTYGHFLRHSCNICSVCKKQFSSAQRLKSHKCENTKLEKASNHEQPASSGNMGTHMYNGNPYQCQKCGRCFKTHGNFVRHSCNICSVCKKQVSSAQRVKSHKCENTKLEKPPSHEQPASTVKVLYNASMLSALIGRPRGVGDDDNFIGDEVITAVEQLMRAHDVSNSFDIGSLSAAAMVVALQQPSHPVVVSGLKPAINFHYLPGHWIVSYLHPNTHQVFVYDSMKRQEHMGLVMPQLRILYGDLADSAQFPDVTQQGADPACGAFSAAFAFSLYLGVPPETEDFHEPSMRDHLRMCILQKRIIRFPVVSSVTGLPVKRKSGDSSTRREYESSLRKKKRQDSDYREKENKGAHMYNGNPYQCQKCERCFKTYGHFLRHSCNICSVCKKQFSSAQRLKSHKCENTKLEKASNHEQPASSGNMGTHMYNGNPYQCQKCGRCFKTHGNFVRHSCNICSVCKKQVSSAQRLKSHKCENTKLEKPPSHEQPASTVKVLYNASMLSALIGRPRGVGDDDNFIGDEVITAVEQLMRAHDVSNSFDIGSLSAAAMVVALQQPSHPVVVSGLKPAINFHYLPGHWIVSYLHPNTHQVFVYDSMKRQEHMGLVMPQLRILYGDLADSAQFPDVTQQGADPACGAFSAAFAFSLYLGVPPETEDFHEPSMRDHLRMCILQKRIIRFPVVSSVTGLPVKRKSGDSSTRREYESSLRKKKRQDSDYREKENSQKRNNPHNREHERLHKIEKREDSENREQENTRKRNNPCNREHKQLYMKEKREDSENREQENTRKRNNPHNREHERLHKIEKREDSENREQENTRKRNNPRNREHSKLHHQTKREDLDTKEKENSQRRSNKDYKVIDRMRKENKRRSEPFKSAERKSGKRTKYVSRKKKTADIDSAIVAFQDVMKDGCTFICTCCDQLWFKTSVVPASSVKCNNRTLLEKCITGQKSAFNKEWMCVTCATTLRRGGLPAMSKANSMVFPTKPDCLNLNQLEERVVAPVNVFFQIRELPRGGQISVKGNVVNVPADNITTVNILPRKLSESDTIPVKLKRKLSYKSHYLCENIRPKMCFDATKFLMGKELFQQHVPKGMDTNWLSTYIPEARNSVWSDFIDKSADVPQEQNCDEKEQDHGKEEVQASSEKEKQVSGRKEESTTAEAEEDDSDQCSEEDEDGSPILPSGGLDTMMYPDNIEDEAGNKCLNIAPSEGNIPLGILSEDVEELAFPTLFCGEKRCQDRPVPVKYSDIVKSELRRADRRAAMCIPDIFFKANKLQTKQIQGKVWLSMRRFKTKGKTYTAGDFKDAETVQNIVKLDDGFRIFRTLRGSPPYWESAKRDIFAMIRQIGIPTWFCSLSAAETRWPELLTTLGQLVDGVTFTEDEISNLSWETKSRLIKSDPVTVARYFDRRVSAFFSTFLSSDAAPIGIVKDYFYRVEFQQRGSPHIHALLWIENAPEYERDATEEVEDFIERYISTNKVLPTCTGHDLVKLQSHRHSHSCRKKKKSSCRFKFPIPPMDRTRLLKPLEDCDKQEIEIHRNNYQVLMNAVENLAPDTEVPFNDFISSIGLTVTQYVNAVRSSLKSERVFLRREPNATKINGYNLDILRSWRANTDIQFVVDAFACAMYIVSYISKAQRGMSDLLRRACEEARKGDSDIRSQVRTIGNKFLRHVEVCEQEAVYLDLQLPLRRCTRGFIFINTSSRDERPFTIKSFDSLENIPDDSEDFMCCNIIIRYACRPKHLENMCLADFAALYDLVLRKSKKRNVGTTSVDIPESDIEDNDDDGICQEAKLNCSTITLTNGDKMKLRKVKKIVRYVRFSKEKDPENHYRELLMLFFPWRDEGLLMGSAQTYEEQYMLQKEQVDVKRAEYEKTAEQLDRAEERLLQEDESDEMWDDVAANTQHLNREDEEETLYRQLNVPDCEQGPAYDIGVDLGLAVGSGVQEETMANRLSDQDFRALVRSLTRTQLEIFYHVLKQAKVSSEQQFIFLTGGAGVGKTRTVKALYQAVVRHYNTAEGENPELARVILVAPTGKAAYLIQGRTIHGAFMIPANQGLKYKRLSLDNLNKLRSSYSKLKMVIIDEVSMVGCNMFNFINQRLQEVTGVSRPFGGISILCIGDLFQLRPVLDNWIFNQPSLDYAPLAPNIWADNFKVFELTDIMRQAEDKAFAEALNRLREGNQTQADITLFKSRLVKPTDAHYPLEAPHLLYYNKDVGSHNERIFATAHTEKVTCRAVDVAVGDVTAAVKEKVKHAAPSKPADSMGLGKTVQAAVGLRNELTVNVDIEDGLVNGAGCYTMHITTVSSKPFIIWMLFDVPQIGLKLRAASSAFYTKDIDKSWTPIRKISREFPVGRFKNVKLLRTQFPFQLACAKTIHRSQGDTLDKAVLSLPKEKRAHLHYVALSRATSLSSVFVLGQLNEDKIGVCPKVQQEMQRLRSNSRLTLCFTPVYTLPDNFFKVCFLNCQSMYLHALDFQADFNFILSDVSMTVETRLCSTDDPVHYQMADFNIHRNDFCAKRSPYGSMIYFKQNLSCQPISCNYQNVELTVLKINQTVDLQLACVYCRPKEKITIVEKAMNHLCNILNTAFPVVIMGDFNINMQIHNSNSQRLAQVLSSYGMRQIVSDVTTNGGTTIDLIFTNLPEQSFSWGSLECYFSYHKPVWIAVDKAKCQVSAEKC